MAECRELRVETRDLTVRYNGLDALRSVTLEIEGPGLVQVLGPNGAGKTTLFKAVAGLVRIARGRILVCGVDITGDSARASALVSYMPQTNKPPSLTPLTVRELVEIFARKSRIEDVGEYMEKVGLPREVWSYRLSDLSGGMFQKALIAATLASRAPILLLDEPLASIDPKSRIDISRVLGEASRDKLIMVASHDPHPLLDYTRTVVLLNREVIACGEPSVVLSKTHPRALYAQWVGAYECCQR